MQLAVLKCLIVHVLKRSLFELTQYYKLYLMQVRSDPASLPTE